MEAITKASASLSIGLGLTFFFLSHDAADVVPTERGEQNGHQTREQL